jgi:hypothetical protein
MDLRKLRGSLLPHRGQRLATNDTGCQQLVQRIACMAESPRVMDLRVACAAATTGLPPLEKA